MRKTSLVSVISVFMVFGSQADAEQPGVAATHSISNKIFIPHHVKNNPGKYANSMHNLRINSTPHAPLRSRSHGYGPVYGHGTRVRSGLHPRHSGSGHKRYYQPYYVPYYSYYPSYDSDYGDRRYNSYYIHGDIPPVYEAQRVVVHDNLPERSDRVVNAANQRQLTRKVLKDITSQRFEAVKELAHYPNLASVAVLIDVLINDASAKVRSGAAESLGKIYHPAAFEALLRSERYDQDDLVRDAAEVAIGEIRYNNSPEDLPALPMLLAMNDGRGKLGDYLEQIRFGRADQRQDAVRQLDRYPGTQAAAALINSIINDPDEYVRKEAAYRLGKLKDTMARPFLAAAGELDPEKMVRRMANDSLEKIEK